MGYAIRRDVVVLALLTFAALTRSVAAADLPASTDQPKIDLKAGLIEVLVPPSIEKAPQAVALMDRTLHKHALLLRSPSLMVMVVKIPEINSLSWVRSSPVTAGDRLADALRVRVIPETNLIELKIDPALAGDDGPRVVEAVVNQYIENENQVTLNKQLERSVMLNNLKNRFQFRKDDLSHALREKAVQLSVDGMGMPGRLSEEKEVELKGLLQLRFDLEHKELDATSPEAKKAIDAQRKELEDRMDSAKADLGALTNAMNQYLTLKEDEQSNRDELKKVNEQLEQIQQMSNINTSELRWLCHPSR